MIWIIFITAGLTLVGLVRFTLVAIRHDQQKKPDRYWDVTEEDYLAAVDAVERGIRYPTKNTLASKLSPEAKFELEVHIFLYASPDERRKLLNP